MLCSYNLAFKASRNLCASYFYVCFYCSFSSFIWPFLITLVLVWSLFKRPIKVSATFLSFSPSAIVNAVCPALFFKLSSALNVLISSLTASSCWALVATWRHVLLNQNEVLLTSLALERALWKICLSLIVDPEAAQSQAVIKYWLYCCDSSYYCGVFPLESYLFLSCMWSISILINLSMSSFCFPITARCKTFLPFKSHWVKV